MNAAQSMSYPRAEALAGAVAALPGLARGAIERIVLAYRRAQAVRDLERLSDRALHDIGLHRSQIRSAVYGGTA